MLSINFKNFDILEHHNMTSHTERFPRFLKTWPALFVTSFWTSRPALIPRDADLRGCMTFGERVEKDTAASSGFFICFQKA